LTDEPIARLPRPYTLTRGRTKPRRNLPLEGVAERTPRGEAAVTSLRGPAGEILEVCGQPITIREIAMTLHLPVGVARVLVDDLVADRLVQVHIPPDERTIDLGRLERTGERRSGGSAAMRRREGRSSERSRSVEVDDRAGERAGDPFDEADLGDDGLPEVVERVGLSAHYDVVDARDGLGDHEAGQLADLLGDDGGLANLGLDEHVGADRHRPSPPWLDG
jgi:hypothetical protein